MNSDNVNDQSKEQQPLASREKADLPEEQSLNDSEAQKGKKQKET